MTAPANATTFPLPTFTSRFRALRGLVVLLLLYIGLFAGLRLPYQAVGAGCSVASLILLAPPFLRRSNSLLFRAIFCLPVYVPMIYIAVTTLSISEMITFSVVSAVLLVWPLVMLRDGRAEVSVRDISVRRPLTKKTISLDEVAAVEPNRSLTGGLLRAFGFRNATTSLNLEPFSHQRTLGLRHGRILLKLDPERQEEFTREVEGLLLPDPFEGALLA